ncbi:MAG TPA: type II toxin-antitoxin system CcdA family antitoxin [Nonomuraea sp.]|nr:type II toxin-antitoxin system CcdA family antitoxin [Nonomuraea sp.]
MARVNVYLPDELLVSAKAAELPISELTQAAVRDALVRRERRKSLERFIDDLVDTQGPATDAEIAEADAWAAAAVAAAPGSKRARAKGSRAS